MARAIENVHSAPSEQSWGSRLGLTGTYGVGEQLLRSSTLAAASCQQMDAPPSSGRGADGFGGEGGLRDHGGLTLALNQKR